MERETRNPMSHGIYADPNPEEVFELAIGEGALSQWADEPNYAGDYMYMYSERIGPRLIRHSFKNSTTRRTDIHVDEIPWS